MPATFDYSPPGRHAPRKRILTELAPAPVASSVGREWGAVEVALHDWPGPGAVMSPALDHDIVDMRISGAVHLEQRRDGKVNRPVATAGNVCLGARDPFVEQIVALFVGELQREPHPAQRLIAESLSYALAVHLVHRFSLDGAAAAPVAGGLDVRTVQRVIDHMQQNLGSPLSLTALANVAAVSRFHFARLFRRTVGVSPMAYLGKLRLQRAQELIRASVEIADLLGYVDQSHFTRRFRLAVGCTPAVYAREHGVVDGVVKP